MRPPRALRSLAQRSPGALPAAPRHAPRLPAPALQAAEAQLSLALQQPVVAGELWAAVRARPVAGTAPLSPQALAQRLQPFTPRLSLEPPDAVLLELRGSLRLFGGLRALWQALQAALPPGVALSLAPTPLAALAFARAGCRLCITDEARLVSRLAGLPLRSLPWPEEALQRLAAMGVTHIGEALRLPREGFARRFGPALRQSLDRLVGLAADPRTDFRPPERFSERVELPFEWPGTDLLLRTLQPALQSLEGFLQQRQRGITALLVLLHHRGGQAATRSLLRLAQPEYRAARFTELLDVQWGRLRLVAPVRSAELRAGALLPCEARSDSLWRPGEQGGEGVAASQPAFLERLQARLGPDAVQGLGLASGYRPERLSAVAAPPAAGAVAARGTASASAPPTPPAQWRAGAHPLWLLPQPQGLASGPSPGGYPWLHGRALQLLAGPERLESGWWDGHDIQRDYYVAADAEGARLWIYRERGSSPPRWFLHGYFG